MKDKKDELRKFELWKTEAKRILVSRKKEYYHITSDVSPKEAYTLNTGFNCKFSTNVPFDNGMRKR